MNQSLQSEFCGDYSVLICRDVPIFLEPFALVPTYEGCTWVGFCVKVDDCSALIVDLLFIDNGVAIGSYRTVGANVERERHRV